MRVLECSDYQLLYEEYLKQYLQSCQKFGLYKTSDFINFATFKHKYNLMTPETILKKVRDTLLTKTYPDKDYNHTFYINNLAFLLIFENSTLDNCPPKIVLSEQFVFLVTFLYEYVYNKLRLLSLTQIDSYLQNNYSQFLELDRLRSIMINTRRKYK